MRKYLPNTQIWITIVYYDNCSFNKNCFHEKAADSAWDSNCIGAFPNHCTSAWIKVLYDCFPFYHREYFLNVCIWESE